MGNDNRYDMKMITVKMTKTVTCSTDGRTVEERKKGSLQTGPVHFLNDWIANDWAKPAGKNEKEETESDRKEE